MTDMVVCDCFCVSDFISRCFPDGIPPQYLRNDVDSTYILSTEVCTPTSQAALEEGMMSFPSGHAVRDG